MLLLILACAAPVSDTGTPTTTDPVDARRIVLQWVEGWPGDSWEQSRQGLWWALSNLGAVPPADESGLTVLDDDGDRVRFELDLQAVGLDDASPLTAATEPVLRSGEYQMLGHVDIGRWLMATLFEPWRYYAITEACPTLEGWQATRQTEATVSYGVTLSQLTPGDRLLTFQPDPSTTTGIGFLAQEGTGSLDDDSFQPVEAETVDSMGNGRQRFAVYDSQGRLAPAADPTLSPAGQPGRCMWCHEGHLMTGNPDNPTSPGHLSYTEFEAQLAAMQAVMDGVRDQTAVPFSWADQADVHTWQELLTESFLHPSPARVAREWQVSEAEVLELVDARGMELAESEEYPDFGLLLRRDQVDDALSAWLPALVARDDHPWSGLAAETWAPVPTLTSARELDPQATGLSGAGLALPSCLP